MSNPMRARPKAKGDRLQLRLDSRAKRTLRRAADYSRQSLSEFVLTTAIEQARRIVREHDVITLSDRDWRLLLDALANPPEPTPRLRRAFERHRKAMGQ